MRVRYAVGADRLLTTGNCAVLLPRAVGPDAIEAIWSQMEVGVNLTSLMGTLFEQGLWSISDVAVAVLDHGRARIVVRGGARVFTNGSWQGSSGCVTWRELSSEGPRIVLQLGDSDSQPESPLLGGVVAAGAVAIEWAPPDSASSDATSRVRWLEAEVSPPHVPSTSSRGTSGDPDPTVTETPAAEPLSVTPTGPTATSTPKDSEPIVFVSDSETADVAPDGDAPGTLHSSTASSTSIDHEDDSYDHLFDVTHVGNPRSGSPDSASEAVPPMVAQVGAKGDRPSAEPPSSSESPPAPPRPDHALPAGHQKIAAERDDITVVRRSQAPVRGQSPSGDFSVPQVLGVKCPRNHLNPPGVTVCRICASGIPPQEAALWPRSRVGVLVATPPDPGIPTRIEVVGEMVLGRSPTGGDGIGPNASLVTIPSPDKDISRRQLHLTVEGWSVFLTDLGSANGTIITEPGKFPKQLKPGSPTPIGFGTRITMAEVVSYTFKIQ